MTKVERHAKSLFQLLVVTKQDVIDAVVKHVVPNYALGTVVVFGGREILEKENDVFIEKGMPPLEIKLI